MAARARRTSTSRGTGSFASWRVWSYERRVKSKSICSRVPSSTRRLVFPSRGDRQTMCCRVCDCCRRRAIDKLGFPLGAARPLGDLISISLAGLRAGFEPKVSRLREEAGRRLEEELRRIDKYYQSLLNDGVRNSDADATGRRAIETEYSRRRTEEERRHQVRVVVHPVQVAECELQVQRAQWELVNRRGVRAVLIAQRWLNGSGDWTLACPECNSSSIRWLSVCKEGHVACDRCALTCGVCDEDFCWDHGIAACHVDGHPTCTEHARMCVSCHEPYCTAHEATCVEGEHPACSECVQSVRHLRPRDLRRARKAHVIVRASRPTPSLRSLRAAMRRWTHGARRDRRGDALHELHEVRLRASPLHLRCGSERSLLDASPSHRHIAPFGVRSPSGRMRLRARRSLRV